MNTDLLDYTSLATPPEWTYIATCVSRGYSITWLWLTHIHMYMHTWVFMVPSHNSMHGYCRTPYLEMRIAQWMRHIWLFQNKWLYTLQLPKSEHLTNKDIFLSRKRFYCNAAIASDIPMHSWEVHWIRVDAIFVCMEVVIPLNIIESKKCFFIHTPV